MTFNGFETVIKCLLCNGNFKTHYPKKVCSNSLIKHKEMNEDAATNRVKKGIAIQ